MLVRRFNAVRPSLWLCLMILMLSQPEWPSHPNAVAAEETLRVGAATAEMLADDDMIIGGGILGGSLVGSEGRLQATALVIEGRDSADRPARLCLIGIDVLMMNRDSLDQAARRIESEVGIPFSHVLINASHTHHAPSTVTIHGYQRNEKFCRRTVEAIVSAAQKAADRARTSPPTEPVFRLGQEATVGQNSRQLLGDRQIYWIGPREAFVRPTGPFDVDLPVLAFRRADGSLAGALFNHSTHCIGTRSIRRSPGFYGLAAQELEVEIGAPVAFLSGASGSTHNLVLPGEEMVVRIKAAFSDALRNSRPLETVALASLKRELPYRIRRIDEAAQAAAVERYCDVYAPHNKPDIVRVFAESRETLRPLQGEQRRLWLQVVRIGDVYLAACPAELFTTLGIEIKRRSPHRNTFVLGLTNDYCGYLPNREAYELGGYQTWVGLHNFAEEGTGERVVEELLAMLEELRSP